MKAAKILVSDYALRLEDKINDFLVANGVTVTDIQYQMSHYGDPYGTSEVHSALIIYEVPDDVSDTT